MNMPAKAVNYDCMRVIPILLLLATMSCLAAADAPFPDTPKNHWVYQTMRQIKKDRLWYRANDNVPKRDVPTRMDLATKTLFLAIDSKTLIDSLQKTSAMIGAHPTDAQSQKWEQQYAASFPKKKLLYQNHLRRVTRLWNFFKPEIRVVAKQLDLNISNIGSQLAGERKELDKIHVNREIAMVEGFTDVPKDHWAAKAVTELKSAGILVGYPKSL